MTDRIVKRVAHGSYTIEVWETPDTQELWNVGYYSRTITPTGKEILDGNEQEYEPKDFLSRDAGDCLVSAQILLKS